MLALFKNVAYLSVSVSWDEQGFQIVHIASQWGQWRPSKAIIVRDKHYSLMQITQVNCKPRANSIISSRKSIYMYHSACTDQLKLHPISVQNGLFMTKAESIWLIEMCIFACEHPINGAYHRAHI